VVVGSNKIQVFVGGGTFLSKPMSIKKRRGRPAPIINGPGADGMFRVHQGSVGLKDIIELLASNHVSFYLHGELLDLEEEV
jgi:hypothetical protein